MDILKQGKIIKQILPDHLQMLAHGSMPQRCPGQDCRPFSFASFGHFSPLSFHFWSLDAHQSLCGDAWNHRLHQISRLFVSSLKLLINVLQLILEFE
jgi:hypothetical protein